MATTHPAQPADPVVEFPRGEWRLRTQRQAPVRIRLHASRSIARLSLLVLADCTALIGAWQGLRVARAFASPVDRLFPAGSLYGPRIAVAALIGLAVFGAYRGGDRWRSWIAVFRGSALAAGLVLWHDLWSMPVAETLLRWLVVSALLGSVLGVVRAALDVAVRAWRRTDARREAVLLIAPEDDLPSAQRSTVFDPGSPFCVAESVPLPEGMTVGEASERVLRSVSETGAGTLMIAGYVQPKIWSTLVEIAHAGGCRLLSMGRHAGSIVTNVRQLSYRGVPVTEVTTPQLLYPQLQIKRAFDLVAAGVGLVILSPLLAVVCLAVKLTSPGPMIFTQDRIGEGGRIFRIMKFRSMRLDAEEHLDELRERSVYGDGRLFKLKDDPRSTKLGSFLRRTSLDELPQLVNVVRGDMSLVGPRPPVPREVVLYEAHHYSRFDMKPGITGPWQISGRNEITDFEEVVLLEREYVREWSLLKDLRILVETVPVVLMRKGAA
jgi:exopolysaccharide biosynthesis polyprenyl glycosylphosphotransferase